MEVAGLDRVAAESIRPRAFAEPADTVAGLLVGRGAHAGGLPLVTGTVPLATRPTGGDEVVGWYASRPGSLAALPPVAERPPLPLVLVVDPLAGVEAAYADTEDGLVRLFHRPAHASESGSLTPVAAAHRATKVPGEPRAGRPAPRSARAWSTSVVATTALVAALAFGILLGLAAWQLLG